MTSSQMIVSATNATMALRAWMGSDNTRASARKDSRVTFRYIISLLY